MAEADTKSDFSFLLGWGESVLRNVESVNEYVRKESQ